MRRPRRSNEEGFALVELIVAALVLVVAVFGVAAALGSSWRQHRQSRATAIAVAAIRDRIAEIQWYANTGVTGLYAYYTSTAGSTFDVPAVPNVHEGLLPIPGRSHVGTILCWHDETGAASPSGASSGDSARAGLPRDLNMDDDAGDANLVGSDMKVVPLKISLDFMDTTGPRHMEVFYVAAPQQ